jgi:hypothetical protein
VLFQRLGISAPEIPRPYSLSNYGKPKGRRKGANSTPSGSLVRSDLLRQNRLEIYEDMQRLSSTSSTTGGVRNCAITQRSTSPTFDSRLKPLRIRVCDPWLVLKGHDRKVEETSTHRVQKVVVSNPPLPGLRQKHDNAQRMKPVSTSTVVQKKKKKKKKKREKKKDRKHWENWNANRETLREEIWAGIPSQDRRASAAFSMHANVKDVVCNISAVPVLEKGKKGWIEIVTESISKGKKSALAKLTVQQADWLNTGVGALDCSLPEHTTALCKALCENVAAAAKTSLMTTEDVFNGHFPLLLAIDQEMKQALPSIGLHRQWQRQISRTFELQQYHTGEM